MSKKFYGIYKSSSSIRIEEIQESSDYKKFSNVIEIENGSSYNGNGNYYMRIFSHGEFKDIVSGNWRVNPFINCFYNWTDIIAKIDIGDVNNKEYTCSTIIDYRSIFKRNGDNEMGIKNVFKFIASLKEFLNLEHYLLSGKLGDTLRSWRNYDKELSKEDYQDTTSKLIEINREFEQFRLSVNNPNDLAELSNLQTVLSELQAEYERFVCQ